jgi:RimJ/RimL family protein N-acetyltransferase
MKALFRAGEYIVKAIEETDIQKTLEIYHQAEDFLSLGPEPHASIEMVLTDIQHSKESGGLFCIILDGNGNQVGVVDFIPATSTGVAFLSLLMIAKKHRHHGIGQSIVKNLESYLQNRHGTHTMESGVQTINALAIGFWGKCGFQISKKAKALDDGTVVYDMKKEIARTSRSCAGSI